MLILLAPKFPTLTRRQSTNGYKDLEKASFQDRITEFAKSRSSSSSTHRPQSPTTCTRTKGEIRFTARYSLTPRGSFSSTTSTSTSTSKSIGMTGGGGLDKFLNSCRRVLKK